MSDIAKVIVQAGGKGSRMKNLTNNRPKCLISLGGRPILYSISEAFGDDVEVIIIMDYKAESLESYLQCFPPKFKFRTVRADGHGTSSGLQKAINLTQGKGFAIVWSDLYFTLRIKHEDIKRNSIGISNVISCRWSYDNGSLVEKPNNTGNRLGIPGIFFFPDSLLLPSVPENGEFVRFLLEKKVILEPVLMEGVKEIGTYETYRMERDNQINSRFFNSIEIKHGMVIKNPRERSFENLVVDEINWYRYVSGRGFNQIPQIINYKPLKMHFVKGTHPYEHITNSSQLKTNIISRILESLQEIHSIDHLKYNSTVAREVYVGKTLERIRKVGKLIPKNKSESYIVNGKKVVNLLGVDAKAYLDTLFNTLLSREAEFKVIHGDPTFSNILLVGKKITPIFIDPRGHFGSSKIFGDPLYDYAKLYYSAIGNYDFFNQGRFSLRLNGTQISIKIDSENFEFTEALFESELGNLMPSIKAVHALIWLSLSGYVIDDYDSVLASYFHGLRLFQEVYDEYT